MLSSNTRLVLPLMSSNVADVIQLYINAVMNHFFHDELLLLSIAAAEEEIAQEANISNTIKSMVSWLQRLTVVQLGTPAPPTGQLR